MSSLHSLMQAAELGDVITIDSHSFKEWPLWELKKSVTLISHRSEAIHCDIAILEGAVLRIRGITITGSISVTDNCALIAENCDFAPVAGRPFSIRATGPTTHVKVHDSRWQYLNCPSIHATNGAGVWISNSLFAHHSNTEAVFATGGSRISIEHCKFENIQADAAITVSDRSHLTVSCTRFEGIATHAIGVRNSSAFLRDSRFHENSTSAVLIEGRESTLDADGCSGGCIAVLSAKRVSLSRYSSQAEKTRQVFRFQKCTDVSLNDITLVNSSVVIDESTAFIRSSSFDGMQQAFLEAVNPSSYVFISHCSFANLTSLFFSATDGARFVIYNCSFRDCTGSLFAGTSGGQFSLDELSSTGVKRSSFVLDTHSHVGLQRRSRRRDDVDVDDDLDKLDWELLSYDEVDTDDIELNAE